MEIQNCNALVSGGASGMGKATALLLKEKGARVVILDRNLEEAKKIAKEIDGIAFACDVRDAKSVEEAIHNAAEVYGPLRICVNCAGIVKGKRLVGKDGPMSLEEFKEIIDVNLVGTFNVMRIAAALMQKSEPTNTSQERGVIINTASIAAFEGQIGQCAYSASKGGIVSLTLPAARELAQFGIRVMTIAPGLVSTPMFDKLPDSTRASLASSIPFPKRLAKAEEFAFLVQHIIENSMLNGEVIRLDGALRMQEK